MGEISIYSTLAAVFPIYGLIAVGWLARRLGWIKPEADSSIVKIAVEITLPCFFISNLLGNKRLESVGFSLAAIGIGAAGILCCLAVSWAAGKLVGLKVGDGLRTFALTVGAHNYGFFLIALVAITFANGGGEMMGILITHNVGCDLVYWSLGFLIVSNAGKVSLDFLRRGPIWSVFLALALVWSGAAHYVPDCVKVFLKFAGAIAVPLNLMIFGTLLCDLFGRGAFEWKTVCAGVFVRMFLLPAGFVAAAVLLPLEAPLKVLIVLQALPPCGVMSAVLARHFGGHPKIAVQITLATCVAALITIPLWSSLWNALGAG